MTVYDDARAAHDRDLESLDHLDDTQLDYLAHIGGLGDPLSDGVDCDDIAHASESRYM